MYCAECGQQLNVTDKYCSVCGCKVIPNVLAQKDETLIMENESEASREYVDLPKPKGNMINWLILNVYMRLPFTKKYIQSYAASDSTEQSNHNRSLLFTVTFLIPIVGIFIGAAYSSNQDENIQRLGKDLMMFAVVMIVVFVIVGGTIIGSIDY
jgi:membrane-associated HD superfamily phosphohydrolase